YYSGRRSGDKARASCGSAIDRKVVVSSKKIDLELGGNLTTGHGASNDQEGYEDYPIGRHNEREHVELFIISVGIPYHVDGGTGHGHIGEEALRATTRISSPEEDALELKPIPPGGADAITAAGQGRLCNPCRLRRL
ncbi:LOW QUALITY PROTEIN: hypothetical protein PHMEG_00011484, partial [Phytophthora megakarya]